ncbi:MAG TPA: beta-galactosidase [Armatimonadota bacterium]
MVITQQIRPYGLLVALLFALSSLGRAADLVRPLPALSQAATWSVAPGSEGYLSVGEAPSCLVVHFRAVKGATARVLLQTPIPIPADVTGFTFLGTTNVSPAGVYLHVILRDAKGREFLAYTSSPRSYQKGIFFPEHAWRRMRQVRFTVPGLARPVPEPRSGATMTPPTPNVEPQRPFTLLGLYCEGGRQQPDTAVTDLYLQDFALTALSPSATACYYQFNDQECYSEISPLPSLTLGDFGLWIGQQCKVSWEARDRYDGQPFLTGGKTYTLDLTGADLPLQMAQRIDIPITEEGTYWVRVKLRCARRGGPIPDEILEREFRLYVKKGQPAVTHPPIAAQAAIPESLIRIAPDRALTFAPKVAVAFPVHFWSPGPGIADLHCRVSVRTLSENTEVKTFEATPSWTGDAPFRMAVDLPALPAGAYSVEATLLSGERPLDRVQRVIGKTVDLRTLAAAPIPASAPAWQTLLARDTPFFHLSPMAPDNLRNDPEKFAKVYQPMMDAMTPVSREMELSVVWRDLEPLPGVYDWGLVDRVLDYAQQKGITVLLWPSMVGAEPEWLPSYYTQNKEGAIFGHNMYLFHGARENFWHAAPVRAAAMRLLANMAARYKSHPAVQGYFFLTEHPGEAPYNGWFDGYDPETLANFRAFAQAHWKTLAALNQHWGTQFPTWAAVVPPEKDALPQYWLDWMQCRMGAIRDFLLDGVKTIRAQDPKRMIMVYADGVDAESLAQFRALGCMLANGGSHDPERGGASYMSVALQGMQERTEDHSPGRWTAYFPTQLDASVFAMTLGGGANAHCKAYMVTDKPFAALRTPPYSLDRYEKFQPIWSALRGTEMLPVDAYILQDFTARLLATHTTFSGGGDVAMNINCFQAHLLCPVGSLALGERGKLLFATGVGVEALEEPTLARLVQYVERGGTLVMRADAGRINVQTPTQPWALLTRFGIMPPTGACLENRYIKAVPVAGAVFPEGTPPFVLRESWPSAPQPGLQTLACYEGDPSRVAMSWKPFGKGKVVVVWASTLIWPTAAAGHAGPHPFLRDLARWACVRLYTDATNPRLWTNLLKDRNTETYYALAYHSVWQNDSTTAITGAVRYRVPEGQYTVTEMIGQQTVGVLSSEQLWAQGIALTLNPRAVAIYRLQKK